MVLLNFERGEKLGGLGEPDTSSERGDLEEQVGELVEASRGDEFIKIP